MIDLVPATPELLAAKDGLRGLPCLRAICGVEDGRLVGIAGTYLRADGLIAFVEVEPWVWNHKRVVVRAARKFFEWARSTRLPVHAMASNEFPKSRQFLVHYGFKLLFDNVYELNHERTT